MGQPLHVLVVDDERLIRLNLRALLEDLEYRVSEASDGAEGLDAFERDPPDIVLADLRMPGMDGMTMIARLREKSPDTPVVVVSGTGAIKQAVESLRLGAWDYITKPVLEAEALEIVIARALDRARLIKENHAYRQHLEELVGERTAELQAAEEELRQAQKMEAFGQLAGGIAHDFNNLLTVIQVGLALVEADPLTPDQTEGLTEVTNAVARATDLTRQLLTFSRRRTPQLHDLDLNEVVSGMTKMLQRLIGEHIQLVPYYTSGPTWVHADAGMLEQVLMNLAINSRDAMPKGGKLVVATDVVDVDGRAARGQRHARPGRFARLSVTDTGQGIAPDLLPRIFEPFFTTKDVGRGTGLGLATAFGIVQQHGGWLDVESEVGVGTTFHVYLPSLAAPPAKPDHGPHPRP